MAATRTLYMHTLDGQPAEFQENGAESWIAFAGSVVRRLAPTLDRIRREQQKAVASAWRGGENQREWANIKRYGYVRVRVPR